MNHDRTNTSTNGEHLPEVRLMIDLRTDADASQLLSHIEDVTVYAIGDICAEADGPHAQNPETYTCCVVDIIHDDTERSSTFPSCTAHAFSTSPPPGTLALLALREIVRARDYHAEHGIYPPGTVSQADQSFDDWAADLAEVVLGGGA